MTPGPSRSILPIVIAAALFGALVGPAPSRAQPAGIWYWCESAKAYFPAVTNCAVAWLTVTVSIGLFSEGAAPPPAPSEATTGPMSVADWILDRPALVGRLVAVRGLAACTIDFDCFLYQPDLLKAAAPFNAIALDRAAKIRLLRCDLRRNRCFVTVTGRVAQGEIAGVAATAISFR